MMPTIFSILFGNRPTAPTRSRHLRLVLLAPPLPFPAFRHVSQHLGPLSSSGQRKPSPWTKEYDRAFDTLRPTLNMRKNTRVAISINGLLGPQ